MNGELLSVLDHIEREKGIKREVLIAAVESALVSAAKKAIGAETADDISVKIDEKTGDIKVLQGKKEIASQDFGRIAAQTAKQVIIQKIREAERDVIYEEYQERIGNIVTGTVHRFEKGNIIVDLGKTEGVIPKKEQVAKEKYKQGERVRGLVIDTRKSGKDPQVTLSRAQPGLVKKLFELEVPEISEGIVEIKAVAREPGDRTKIAVWSKQEKVDCVGACVGMRGSRVKDIVRELHNEKIDIIKWNEDIAEYIKAALSPAEISQIKTDKESKKVQVIVNDDQLSLAIGKRGQNVRLAVKLTGWDIDITAKSALEEVEGASIAELPRIGPKTFDALVNAGFDTIPKIAKANVKELTDIQGVGKTTAANLIEAAKERLEDIKPKKKDGGEKTKDKEGDEGQAEAKAEAKGKTKAEAKGKTKAKG